MKCIFDDNIHGTLRLSVHLPSGRMTMKNSNRFDGASDDAEERSKKKQNSSPAAISLNFDHFLFCSEIVVYFFFFIPSSFSYRVVFYVVIL